MPVLPAGQMPASRRLWAHDHPAWAEAILRPALLLSTHFLKDKLRRWSTEIPLTLQTADNAKFKEKGQWILEEKFRSHMFILHHYLFFKRKMTVMKYGA